MKNSPNLIIIHVVEAYEGGVIEFINSITQQLPHHTHIIIRSEREGDINVKYSEKVSFIKWKHAQREISFIKDIKAGMSLLKTIKTLDYDAIHLHSSKAGFIGRIIIPFLKNKEVIYSPNGAAFNRLDVSNLKRVIFKILEYVANLIGGRVISVSKSEAQDFNKIKVKSFYINNGIEITQNTKNNESSDKIVIGTIGRTTEQKNPILFNQIAKQYLDNPNIRFLWIGGGKMNNLLDSPNIEITGWLSKIEAVKNLSNIDIYLSTALWEGLPFAVLDAMNYKKPLVLKRCTGNTDLVTNNGYLFNEVDEAKQALDSFIFDKEKTEIYGLNSYTLLKKEFSVVNMAQQYEYAYLGQFEKLNTIRA